MTVTNTKELANEVKLLFRELPFNGFNFIDFHGQFKNSLNTSLPTKTYLERLTINNDINLLTYKPNNDINLFSLKTDSNANTDRNLNRLPIQCKYYSPHSFSQSFGKQNSSDPLFFRYYTIM